MNDPRFEGVGMTSRRTRQRLVAALRGQGIADERVLDAIGSVPRHIFIEEALAHRAYENQALPIGRGQTISQPYVVAAMTEALLHHRPRRVLEIGTGSGYQTAILAGLVEQVYTIERIRALADRARRRLAMLSISNVRIKHGDGRLGWAAHAPFDGVLVTAWSEDLPDALMEQLADRAPLVIPVGDRGSQQLKVLRRAGRAWRQQNLAPVRFVPLLSGVES